MALPIQFNWGTEYRPVTSGTSGGSGDFVNVDTRYIKNAYVHYIVMQV